MSELEEGGHDGGGGEDELDDDYGYYGTGEEEHDDHLVSAPVPDTRQGHPSDQTGPWKVSGTNVHRPQHVQEVFLNC